MASFLPLVADETVSFRPGSLLHPCEALFGQYT